MNLPIEELQESAQRKGNSYYVITENNCVHCLRTDILFQ